ncbi:geranylgeranyl diphosphate synthase type II [Microbacterium terrae]|uniref:Octaprenyl-diphosphate synthase n=1 Tax=Microbacterium terrae TaxID=69369 RepID=A0A0M2HAZ1_9MICO|nr:polyprenyl synthetase family protein [Microbacterium terrae]KJL43708.1 Octaprenyl-diphosphate synthase [Microbacterium terrae]KJL43757.1 Octaprenyl-diphosphate synthase [Microbacterium terrae]MBP1077004.1 geranylgeranyl diphosphate synthase type II [Microbacterium terrae]GLJ99597.1 geranylgeranyl pyrophosphate synthase [Microbacterium terrae]
MIATSDQHAIDEAIEASLARIRAQARTRGTDFAALSDALSRATRGGKRLRPALVVRAYDAFGGPGDHRAAAITMAAAYELLHTAFVVHDDVIDHDTMRRGVPNVAGEFRRRGTATGADATGAALLGDAAAILAGDLLLVESVRLVATVDASPAVRTELLAILDDAVFASAAGELADVAHSVASDIAEPDALLSTTHDKTAVYSFSAPLRTGAVLAGASAGARDLVAHAGGRLGLAFQLVDDLIGAFGSEAEAGRDRGADLRERKRTPLLAYARTDETWNSVRSAVDIAHTGPVAVREAQRALEHSGARTAVAELIAGTLDDARTASRSTLLPTAAGDLLREIADAVEKRMP